MRLYIVITISITLFKIIAKLYKLLSIVFCTKCFASSIVYGNGAPANHFVTLILFTLVFSTEERKFKTTTYKGNLDALKNSKKEKKKYDVRQPRFTSEDLRPVGGDDYEY